MVVSVPIGLLLLLPERESRNHIPYFAKMLFVISFGYCGCCIGFALNLLAWQMQTDYVFVVLVLMLAILGSIIANHL
jgi:hypothetical protein